MNHIPRTIKTCMLAVMYLLLTSCDDWSSGSQANFNSSLVDVSGQLEGVTISETYNGTLSGGRAVSDPYFGTITALTLTQNGNTLSVRDNQGSNYTGTVGEMLPDTVATSELKDGTVIANWSVSWSGRDNVALENVTFTGNVQLVFTADRQNSNTRFVLSGTWNEQWNGRMRVNTVAAQAPGPTLD